jgi:agmatinase
MKPVSLTGLPTDAHSSFLRGAAKAPKVIREALRSPHSHMTASNGLDLTDIIRDLGDAPIAGDAVDYHRIVEAARVAFESGPAVFLGGDHMVTHPILAGYAEAKRPPPQVVHIDAHPDLYADFEGDPLSHASPFARILEKGLCSSLTQLGIRTMNAHLRDQAGRYGVRVFSPADHAAALTLLPHAPTYISIDLDGLDPAYAPGVSHHEPGGLTTREVLDVIWKAPGPVIGADIVELNPDRDVNGMTATLAAKLLKELTARISADAAAMAEPPAQS